MADSKPAMFCGLPDDEWRRVFRYLGKGLYLQLACVHPSLGPLYAKSFKSGGTHTSFKHLVASGSLALVQWAALQGAPTDYVEDWAAWAAKYGNWEILEWWYGVRGKITFAVYAEAAARGDVDMLQWCFERGGGKGGLSTRVCHRAAANGHLDALKWAREHDCPWSRCTFIKAAEHGHLEVCKWLNNSGCNCWFDEILLAGAQNNHLHIAQWAEEQWSGSFTTSAWVEVAHMAGRGGFLQLAEWSHAAGFPGAGTMGLRHYGGMETPGGYMLGAAQSGHVYMLEWARSKGYAWGPDIAEECAANHRLEALRWLVDQGCPWDPQRCLEAAARCGGPGKEVCEWIEAAAAGGGTDGNAADGAALLAAV